ncbi:MAG: hypothetical protein RLY66_567 [Candidatus Parcubacteria bacterium]|jgi:glycosyltransferase involved in cell wall biosynthesis
MKKLLMISTDAKILQEGSAVRARQEEYAKSWDEVHIIVFGASGGEVVITPNCWAYPTNSSSKLMNPFAAMRLGRFLVEKRGITNITCQDPFLTSMTGVALKKQFPQIEFEIQVHTDIGSSNFTYTLGNKTRKFLALNYLPKADHIRVVSNKIKDFLIEKLVIDASKIEVKPIVVDTEKVKAAQIIEGADLHKKYPQFEKIVLMASRLEKEKNIELAIKAWVKVIEKIPKAGLVIVGSGSKLPFLKALATNLKVEHEIIFEGWADQATLYSYYKTTDAFLNASLFEGYGMTLIEAQAAGCKIISTDVGVAREVGVEIIPFDSSEKVAESIITNLHV